MLKLTKLHRAGPTGFYAQLLSAAKVLESRYAPQIQIQLLGKVRSFGRWNSAKNSLRSPIKDLEHGTHNPSFVKSIEPN